MGAKDGVSTECNVLSPELCRVVNSDAYTLILSLFAALQLTWVTMLMFVQLVQISRAMTTWENMRGAHHGHGHGSKASEAITSALTTGTTTTAGAQIGGSGSGPDPALPGHGHHHHKEGCFAQWKKILGVDTFVETVQTGNKPSSRRNRNAFSNGCITNCKDFWCDPAPVFGRRENGSAMLGGQPIDYTAIYETPRLMTTRSRGGGGAYESLGTDDSV